MHVKKLNRLTTSRIEIDTGKMLMIVARTAIQPTKL